MKKERQMNLEGEVSAWNGLLGHRKGSDGPKREDSCLGRIPQALGRISMCFERGLMAKIGVYALKR